MRRRDFVSTCGMACMGLTFFGTSLSSCISYKTVSGKIENEYLVVSLDDFYLSKRKKQLSYLIVRNQALKYPVCLYRITNDEFTALLMKCTHQGVELQAYGDKLFCSAHGSEFDKTGKVMNGPATDELRNFSVIKQNNELKITLK